MKTLATRLPCALIAAALLGVAPGVLAQDAEFLMNLPTEGRRLGVGEDHVGRLDEGDVRYEGKYVQAWSLSLGAGQTVTIDNRSEDFDAYLLVVGPGLGVLSDDDGAGNRDARIFFTAPESGRYVVVATTFASETTGAYTLSVASGERLGGEAGRRQELLEIPIAGELTVGDVRLGRLQVDDATFEDKYADGWALDLSAGQEVTVDHLSEDFDSYLYVVGPGLDEVLSDDDGAGDLDSRIDFEAPATGRYHVVASSFGSDATGSYTLRVREGLVGSQWEIDEAEQRAALEELPTDGRTVRVGGEVTGRLDPTDREHDDRYVEAWALDLVEGQEVSIDHVSEDFDSYLYVVGPGLEYVLTDDDGAGDLDARITFTAPETGRYTVVASALSRAAGDYTLRVRDRAEFFRELPTAGRRLRLGEEASGRLTAEDAADDGRHVQAWRLDLDAGQDVTIDLVSEDFDCLLYVLGPGVDGTLRDDDGAGDLDSRVSFTTSASGRFQVVASTFGSGDTGEYTLRVREGRYEPEYSYFGVDEEELLEALAERSTDGRILAVGMEVDGYLSEDDVVADLDRYVQVWGLELAAGEDVTVDLLSDDFDSYLRVSGPGLDEVLSNDDGGVGLNSRIAFTAAATGRYRVYVSSLGEDDLGGFTVGVRAGLEPEDESDFDFPDWEYTDPSDPERITWLLSLPTEGRRLTIGADAFGELSAIDVLDDDDSYLQAWSLDLTLGQEVTVDLLADDFDAYLMIAGPGLDAVLTDDDGAGGLNSRITFTAPETGAYQVVANSLGSEDVGAFTIRVVTGDVHQTFLRGLPTGDRRLVPDDEAMGELAWEDPTDAEGKYVQAWALPLQRGDRVRVDLVSDDFDPYLVIFGPGLDEPLEDDDSAGDLDSRITFTALESGTFTVVVTSFGEDATGGFTLRVERR